MNVQPNSTPPSTWRRWLPTIAAGLIIAVGGGIWLIGRGGNDSVSTSTNPPATDVSAPIATAATAPPQTNPATLAPTPSTMAPATTTAVTTPVTAAPAPTTVAPAPSTTAAAPITSGSAAPSAGLYEPADMPAVWENDQSAPVVEPLADGNYASWAQSSADGSISFTLSQIFIGDACLEHFSDDTFCAGDIGTEEQPSATVAVPIDSSVPVISNFTNAEGLVSYRITTAEFARLLNGEAPDPSAPAGLSFSAGLTAVTIQNGQVTAIYNLLFS